MPKSDDKNSVLVIRRSCNLKNPSAPNVLQPVLKMKALASDSTTPDTDKNSSVSMGFSDSCTPESLKIKIMKEECPL